MFDITLETQSCIVTTQQPLIFNNNSNHSNLQQPQVLTTEIAPKWGVTRESTVFDCQDLTTEIAPERGVTRESTVFDCLDPDPWCFPNLSEHHQPNPTTPSSIHSSIHQSTSESMLRNPTSVFPSSFANTFSSLDPGELGSTLLLRTGDFTANTVSCCKASKAVTC